MIFDSIEKFRKKIAEKAVVGPFAKSLDPAFIEVIGYSGFDFMVLDMEHGPANVAELQNLIRAAEVSGTLPIVRVPENSLHLASAALDVGAGGVQIPRVETADAARKAVAACRYAPQGMRGVCRFVRNAGYSSMERNEYFKEANQAVCVIQLEGLTALDNLDEILDVEGVDIIFIGPYDLSQSLGITGDVQNIRVKEAAKKIIDACAAKGIAAGIFADTPEQAAEWKEYGIRYLCYSVDVGLFYDICRQQVSTLSS